MFQGIRVSQSFADGRLHMHNEDLDLLRMHLNESRGPTHLNYLFNVLNTYRFRNLPGTEQFPRDSTSYQFLMHGMHGKEVVHLIQHGFQHIGTTKQVFGPNYYFTNCSTKAANYINPRAWNYEKHADRGIIRPKMGDTGYILYCLVATGRILYTRNRNKTAGNFDWKVNDSMIFQGKYEPVQQDAVKIHEIDAILPRGPFQKAMDLLELNSEEEIYYDEICVDTPNKVYPFMLAEVSFENMV